MRIRATSLPLPLLLALALTFAAPASADRAFESRFTANQPGDVTIIANTVMTCPASAACTAAQGGGNAPNQNNNNFSMVRVDVDSDPTTVTSSRATLATPPGATVLWAGLYWFGNTADAARNTVKLQAPGQAGYTSLTATTLDTSGTFYQGFRDVTAAVAAAGNGVYTAADVRTNTGTGLNGGWAVVVVYGDATQPPRNLSIFDGLVTVPPTPRTITVNGFTTPPAGAVNTTLGAVSSEGDLASTGDSMSLNNTLLSNGANPQQNVFNSTITTLGNDLGGRTPNYKNQLGMDADLFNANGILGNLATNATIKLTTGGETYLPGVVTFSTELYAPVVVPDKTVTNRTHPGGPAQVGDTLRYTLSFENTGQDAAAAFSLKDPIPAGATYEPGTLNITAGPNAPATPTDTVGDDLGEFDSGDDEVRFRLGAGASATSGGTLAQGATVTATFDVTIDAGHQEGDVIANRGSSDYRGQTVGTPFLDQLTPEVETVVHVPDLALAKTHTPDFLAGVDTTFTLVASNVGTVPTDGSQVTVTDTFPSGAAGFDSITNADGPGWSCSIAGPTLTCTRSDTLPSGESYPPILVDARVHDPIAPTIVNNATIAGGGDANAANNGATDSGGATAQADVQVSKRTTTPEVASGGIVEWVVDVHNAGPSTAADVTLDDALSGADYDQIVATPNQGTCDTAISCDFGSIVPGGTASVTIRARALANDTTLTNTASATTTTTDPDSSNDSGEASVTVANTADVRILKTGAPENPSEGDPYAYTLEVDNDGPGAATEFVVSDQLPAALAAPVVSASGWSCNSPAAGGILTCTLASLGSGSAAPDITVSGTILAGAGGAFFSNTAAVDTSSTDPNPGNNTSSTTELATPAADLSVTKTFSPATPVLPGAVVTAQLVVTNNGPSTAVNATLEDVVPPGLEVTAVSSGCTESPANAVNCSFGDMTPSESETVTVTATVNPPADPLMGDTITNTATVDTDTGDPIPSNNSDRDRVTVVPAADVSIAKTASPAAPAVGDLVTYTLAVSNAGPSTASGVSVSDAIPGALSFVSASAGCAEAGGTVTCAPPGGTLASGADATFTITATVGAAGAGQRVGNTATVSTTTPHDPDPSNNESSTDIDVQPRADLEIEKTVGDPTPAIDADDTFTLTVTNNGPNDADDVAIDDPLPAGMTFVSASQGCGLVATAVHCDIGTLASGDSVSREITLRAGPALHGQSLSNTASVGSSTPDPDAANNDDSADVTVGERVDLALAKTVAPPTVPAGGTATYTLAVTNDGPSSATGVTLTDALPPGLDFVSAAPSQGTCAIAAATVTCSLGTIAAGVGAEVLVTVRPTGGAVGQPVDNTATVTSNEPEPRTADNSASTGLGVTPAPVPVPVESATRCFFGNRVTILGTNRPETIVGTPGRDVINGRRGNDTILGLDGNDLICGGAGNDLIKGGRGDDRVKGSTGDDKIRGNLGSDWLRGAPGDDRISGRQGADRLMGNDGDDRLRGRSGNDELRGGPGLDWGAGGPGLDTGFSLETAFGLVRCVNC